METGCAERVLEQIAEVLRESHGIEDKITSNTNFRQLGLDSLEMAEFIIELEEIFGIDLPDDDMKKMFTIADAIRYVDSRRG